MASIVHILSCDSVHCSCYRYMTLADGNAIMSAGDMHASWYMLCRQACIDRHAVAGEVLLWRRRPGSHSVHQGTLSCCGPAHILNAWAYQLCPFACFHCFITARHRRQIMMWHRTSSMNVPHLPALNFVTGYYKPYARIRLQPAVPC